MRFEWGSLGLKSLLKTSLVVHPWVGYFTFRASASTPIESMITQPWRRVVQITRQPRIGACVVPASGWAPWFPLVPSHQPLFGLCLCLLHVSLLLLPFHSMREKGSLWSLCLEGCRSIFLPQWSRIIQNLYSAGSADFFPSIFPS